MPSTSSISFGLLDEPETRKPSKARLLFAALFLVLLVLAVVFISLYAVEKSKSDNEGSSSKQKQNGTVTPSTTAPPANGTTSSPTHSTAGPTPSAKTCRTPTCVTSAADILNKLDQSTKPCDDFYQYSCGGFLKKRYIPGDGKSYINALTTATDVVHYTMRDILQNEQLMKNYSADPNSAVYKGFVYYKSCMNDSAIKNAGIKPIRDVIEKYGSWNITNSNWSGDSWELEKILARLLVDIEVPAFFALDIKQSYFNTSEVFVTIGGGFSGYDDRLLDEEQTRSRKLSMKDKYVPFNLFKDYKIFMSTIFRLLGSNSSIDEEVKRIMELEYSFSEVRVFFDPKNLKRSDVSFMTVDELNKFTSFKFNWTTYFTEMLKGTGKLIAPNQKIMVLLPNNVKKIAYWLADKPKSLLANEIMWNTVKGLMNTLPKAFTEAQRKYYLSFKMKLPPRWKTCNGLTDKLFTHVTTLLYVNGKVSENALKTSAAMFDEIKSQFVNGLKEQYWMDNATRAQAHLKLDKMRDWIGFPSIIKNTTKLNSYYSNIQVDESRLLQNNLNVLRDKSLKKMNEVGKPPDDGRFMFSPLTVNAYYNPQANGMTILAGILQPPFYEGGRLKALNYGSLGMIVGHEITHGFDKTGSKYDENGNFRQWWTNSSRDNFVKRSKCLIDQYNNVTIFGLKVDGKKTLSENIADNGGLKYAFRAYQKWRETNGDEERLPALPFDNNQLFFVSFAQLWCAKYGKGAAKTLMLVGDHSLDPVRVRVPLHNFPEFSKAFGCPMPNNTCAVW